MSQESHWISLSAQFLLATLIIQYLMGAFLRHLREAWAWMIHPWFALVVLFAMAAFVWMAKGTESPYLHRWRRWPCWELTVSQSLIGLATWYVKYGVPSWGVVAQQDSSAQVVICSLHTIVGMLTLMTSVLAVFCCWAVKPVQSSRHNMINIGNSVAGVAI